jgi:hypothetical protein
MIATMGGGTGTNNKSYYWTTTICADNTDIVTHSCSHNSCLRQLKNITAHSATWPSFVTRCKLPYWVQFILWMAFINCEWLVVTLVPCILKVAITQHDYG